MPKDKLEVISQQIFAVGLPIKEVATGRCGSQHFELEAEIYPVNQNERKNWKCERNIKVKRLVSLEGALVWNYCPLFKTG